MKKAAELGLPEAQHNLADYYKRQNDLLKAVAWFLKAAKNHFYPSVLNIGHIFLNGEGPVLSNPVAALIWFQKAQLMNDSAEVAALIEKCVEAIAANKSA
jgi:TPR repeat protein